MELNSRSSLIDVGPAMWRTQAFWGRASATVAALFLLRTAANTVGAMSWMLEPASHRSVQKSIDSPLPRMKIVAAWNSASAALSLVDGGAPISLSFHTHRARSAIPDLLRSAMTGP